MVGVEMIVGATKGWALPLCDNFLQGQPKAQQGLRKCDRKHREGAV
jgi:hypothetical protein